MRVVFDGHVDALQRALDLGDDLGARGRGHFDLVRAREGGLGAVVLVSWVDPKYVPTGPCGGSYARARALIGAAFALEARHPELLRLVGNAEELEGARSAGQVAGILGIEGGHALEGSLERLDELLALGLRVLTLVWNNHLDWIRSCQDGAPAGTPAGLSDFGREVVRRLQRAGALVDLSHAGERSFYDTLEVAEEPVLVSHSGCAALCRHPRNLSDDQLRALGEQGGVVGIPFHPGFLDEEAGAADGALYASEGYRALRGGNDTETELLRAGWMAAHAPPLALERVADHVVHAVELAGVEHVGFGSDFDGILRAPEGLGDASGYARLAPLLAARGFEEGEVRGLLGDNLRRLFRRSSEGSAPVRRDLSTANANLST